MSFLPCSFAVAVHCFGCLCCSNVTVAMCHHRLTGERGFKVLKNEFPLIKFRGKGHEASDLKLLMSRYEHWAHRLFPKMTFQDVLERIEKLAVHKEVKVCASVCWAG